MVTSCHKLAPLRPIFAPCVQGIGIFSFLLCGCIDEIFSPLTVEELKQAQVELTKCASTAEVATDSQSCGTGDCGCKGTSLRSMGNTELVLCYACTRLLAETSSSSVLPATVLVRGARLRNSAQLRSQIEEYLLE